MGTLVCFIAVFVVGVLIPTLALLWLDRCGNSFCRVFAAFVGGLSSFVVAWWVRPVLSYPGGGLTFAMLCVVVLTLTTYSLSNELFGKESSSSVGLTLGVVFTTLLLVWNFGVAASSWDIFRADARTAVIGQITIHDEAETRAANNLDFSHARLNTPESAEAKFKSRSSELGGQTSLVDFAGVWPLGDDRWIGATEPKPADPFGFGKLLEQGGLHGYFTVSADDPISRPELNHLEDGIKYTPTSFGRYNTYRQVYNAEPGLSPLFKTLHVNQETGHPENVISLGLPSLGFDLPTVTKVAIQDAINGELQIFDLKGLPDQYQLVLSPEMVVEAFDNWGAYRMGWYEHAFGRANLENVTEAFGLDTGHEIWLVKGNDGRYKYYMTFMFRNTTGSIDGYVLTDTRTWETDMYIQPSADPSTVRATMQSNAPATSGHPWNPSEPKQYRTRDGMLVWIATYTSNGAFQGIGISDLWGNVAASGRTTDAALEAFRARIFENPELLGDLASTESKAVALTGNSYVAFDNGQSIAVFEVDGLPKPIEIQLNRIDRGLPMMPSGTKVIVQYLQFNHEPLVNHGAIRGVSMEIQ